VLRRTAYSFNLARLARASFSAPSIGPTLNGFPPRLKAEGSFSVPPSIGEGDAWLGTRIGDVAFEGGRMKWSRLSEQFLRIDKWSVCQG
jgi:hypothetical protein